MNTTPPGLRQLRRVRWAVRATLAFGVAASVAANILHARQNPISETIAAWPPLALLLTIELVSRVPVHRRSLGAIRVLATAIISGIAAWVSYWHMMGVASRYGETGTSPYLLPVSVDGLIVVASISLVELASRIRSIETSITAPAVMSTVVTAAPTPRPAAPAAVVQIPAEVAPEPPAPRRERDGLVLNADLIGRARTVATAHRRTSGTDITPAQLAGYLRLPEPTAAALLDQLADTNVGGLVAVGPASLNGDRR